MITLSFYLKSSKIASEKFSPFLSPEILLLKYDKRTQPIGWVLKCKLNDQKIIYPQARPPFQFQKWHQCKVLKPYLKLLTK